MKRTVPLFIAALMSMTITGCSNLNKQDIGTLGGGLAGGLIGSRFGGGTGQLLAVGAGALAGAYLGGAMGKNMDENDQRNMQQAVTTVPVGQQAAWTNSRTGTQYTVTPIKQYQEKHHARRYCREYLSTATINGNLEKVHGTACRKPDGSWEIQTQ